MQYASSKLVELGGESSSNMQELQRHLAIRINQVKRQKQTTQLEQGRFSNQQITSNILQQCGRGRRV